MRHPGDLARKLNDIRSLDLRNIEIDLLKSLISELMKGYVTITQRLSDNAIYRARLFDSDQNIECVSELWYPPIEKVKTLGRLNRVNKNIFYCSENEGTAILELRPRVGDTITVLKCELKDPNVRPYVMQLGMKEIDNPSIKNLRIPNWSNLTYPD
jgi:hypothetical protein